ncbi:MAG TPA: GIY-YIG nuclease family protein [Parafilimonas sp.]|nr:GIY-YIG nuclease family protein [Parafilimonas sp.]
MPFYVYILYAASAGKYYVGQTENLEERLFRHTNSGSKSTKFTNDWKLVYTETFSTRVEAVKRETEIKNKKSRKYIEWLISSVGLERPEGFREGHPVSKRDILHYNHTLNAFLRLHFVFSISR